MRRRRQQYQVSTFSFLAVLLCAMGSLILLLLVIDRRAKIVARQKAMQAATEVAEAKARKARQQAEREEKRRQQEREGLVRAQQSLLEQTQQLQGQFSAESAVLQKEKARRIALTKQLEADRLRTARAREGLAARQAALDQTRAKDQAVRDEVAKQEADLQALERLLEKLKTAREQQKQTYSVVPYRGPRGGDRQPIYVECAEKGVTFHPDPVTLASWDLSRDGLLAELRRRTGRSLQTNGSPDSKDTEPPPYLLMLVRPEGIANYYRTRRALQGLKIEFGYELIEPDWVLDFRNDRPLPVPEPPKVAAAPDKRTGSAAGVKPIPFRTGPVTAEGHVPGVASGGNEPGRLPWLGDPAEKGTGTGSGSTTPAPGMSLLPLPSQSARGKAGTPAAPSPKDAGPVLKGNAAQRSTPLEKGTGESARKSTIGTATKPVQPPEPGANAGGTGKPDKQGEPGEPGPPSNPLARPGAGPAVPLSRLTGNRDWVIYIDCKADEVVLLQTGQRFATASLTAKGGTEHPLAEAVRELIARRQATVRKGEPPYRPLLRFRVGPDSWRSYYMCYPLLERLRLPMSRENRE